ncbi:MAG TPA: NAD(P)-dependent oxidoreductase [Solirubrobacteraceae bacterium]|nr:NAD(P)-dependent oxidoreductase [Solirubrobacteraceae bacterium]
MNTMRVFFAGASGAIGPPAVRELLERGHEVVAMTSSTAKAPRLADLGAEPVVADALDAGALTRAVRAARPDAVVNMMTRIPAKPARPSHMRATNELRERGVRNLLDAAVAAGARRFVSESFFGVYGFGPHERPRTEDDPIGRERNPGVQAVVDAIASSESQVRAASDERRIEGVSLRFAAFQGPLAPNTATMVELVRNRRLPVVGAQGATMPVVELGDAARAVADALERAPAGRIYNVADDEAVAMVDYLTELARVVGAPPPRHVPYWLVRVAAPYMATFMGRARVPMSNARITEELGWRPRYPTYREALALLDGHERDVAGVGRRTMQRA